MTSSLYGSRDPAKQKHKPISSSSSLAFSSNLSNLISSAKTPSNASTASRPKLTTGSKSSIFSAHNKNVKKRALADEQHEQQQHRTSASIGHASESELHRSKRKMLEKTRLYNAMKRGEYLNQSEYDDRSGLVDFDRKWADSQRQSGAHRSRSASPASSSDDGSDSDSSSASQPNPSSTEATEQWTDEFGRLITGTASQHRRHQRRQRIAAAAEAAFQDTRARPSQPSSIIYGDTIQHAAFNPDTVVQDRMAELAAKRDKEATPPPETHYDGQAEIRTKGTGFYGFSKDEELRKKEMEELEKERVETDRRRKEREEAKMARMREVEERRRVVREKRAEREVDAFLDGLEVSMPVPVAEPGGQGQETPGDEVREDPPGS